MTGFVNDITDGIRSNPITSGAPYFVNIAGMRIWGLEVEGSYESERLFARLAYTFTRGEYTETFIGSNASNTRDAGDPLDSLPQDRVSLTVGTRLPEQSLEIGGTITVAKLRQWIDTPSPMGLPIELQNLIILAFAASTNRRFTLRGVPMVGLAVRAQPGANGIEAVEHGDAVQRGTGPHGVDHEAHGGADLAFDHPHAAHGVVQVAALEWLVETHERRAPCLAHALYLDAGFSGQLFRAFP